MRYVIKLVLGVNNIHTERAVSSPIFDCPSLDDANKRKSNFVKLSAYRLKVMLCDGELQLYM